MIQKDFVNALVELVDFLNEDFDKICFERKNGKGHIIGIREDGSEVRSNIYRTQKECYDFWLNTEKTLYDSSCEKLTIILRDQ